MPAEDDALAQSVEGFALVELAADLPPVALGTSRVARQEVTVDEARSGWTEKRSTASARLGHRSSPTWASTSHRFPDIAQNACRASLRPGRRARSATGRGDGHLAGEWSLPCRRPGLRQRPQISPWCRQRPPHGRRHQRPCPLGATSAGATPGSGTASGGRALRGPGRVLNGGVVPDIALPVAMEIEGQYRPLPAPLETPYRHFLARCYRAPGAAGGGEAGRGSGPGTLSEGQRSEMTGTPLAVAALACRSS